MLDVLSLRRCVLALLALPIASSRAHADVPILDGHRFVPSPLVAWAFIDSEVSSTSEVGFTSFAFSPVLALPVAQVSQLGQVDGRFVEATQALAGSVAIGEVASVFVQLSADGILPINAGTAVFVGGHAALGESAGVSLRLVRTDSFLATLRADFNALEVESVLPARLPDSPRVAGHVFGVRPALAAALALTSRFGLQGSFAIDFQRYDVAQTDDLAVPTGALALTLSLDPVPLTLLAGASVAHTLGRDVFTPAADAVFGPNQTDWNVEGGIYYTARRELDLGLLFRAEVDSGANNSRYHGVFRLGYYF